MGLEALLTGFGLSGSAGLNAYLPLLIIGMMGRAEVIDIAKPYNIITEPVVLLALAILLLVEVVADKLPAIDSANDVVNTFIRPVAGAILFGASTSTIKGVDPEVITALSLLFGGVSAGGVHLAKATARPAVTVSTGGTGNFVVSIIEDVISITVSLVAILLPYFVMFFALSFAALVGWQVWDMRRVRRYFPRSASEA